MSEPILKAKGVNGQLELYPTKVIIKRKGAMGVLSHGFKGDKSILIKQISSIQFKQANPVFNGYIQFAFLGGVEAKGGLFQAGKDENTVNFSVFHKDDFTAIKEKLEEMMEAAHADQGQSSNSSISDLEKLAELKEKGIITEEEFNAKKKQILGI